MSIKRALSSITPMAIAPKANTPKRFNTMARIQSVVLATALCFSPVLLAQSTYDDGQRALQQRQWQRAVNAFESVIDSRGENTDAALYWQAYAYYQMGNSGRAERVIQRLRNDFPNSAWLDDAQALTLEHQSADSNLEVGELDDELKVYALAALMESHPQRALPLAADLLRNSDNPEAREQALFVLSASKLPEARAIIREIATGPDNDGLRDNAIYFMADEGSEASMEELFKLYQNSSDNEVKETVLYALGNNDQVQRVVQLLSQESDGDLQAAAIYALANMEAVDQINRLDLAQLTEDGREAAIYAYAQTSTDNPANIAELQRIYQSSDDPELKETVLYALGNSEQEEIIAELLARESDGELQATAIYALNNMEAHDRLRGLNLQQLSPRGREALIHTYGEIGDVERLRHLLNQESDSDNREQIIYAIAHSGKAEGSDALLAIYEQTDDQDQREAVIHGLMQLGQTEPLLRLLKRETDHELKAAMVRALAESDDPKVREYLFRMLEQ